jgi:subtilase family serine protease
MVKQKWLMILGIVILFLLPVFSLTVTPVGADSNPWRTVQHQSGHYSPPIHYGQVDRPLRPDRPGQGPHGTTAVVYTPSNIQTAYSFGNLANGTGKTIAIIDAFGDPTLNADVSTFDGSYGLSTSWTPNIYYPDGKPVINRSNQADAAGWAVETALDVEWAHANAPNATIDLIVAYDDTFQHLLDAVNYSSDQGNYTHTGLSPLPVAISMSFGAPENEFTATTTKSTLGPWETAFAGAQSEGIILLAASGDGGATDGTRQLTVDYPAASQYVIGVGGTTLKLTSSSTWSSETAWTYSGGGYGATSLTSVFGKEPSFQKAVSIPDSANTRGVPDVAFDADPNTGVYVYCSPYWYDVGGTSVGAPNWAAILADATASSSPSLNLGYLYGTVYGVSGSSSKYGTEIHDIKSGNNGYYTAGTGWDAVTGIGSPIVSGLLTSK